MSGRTPSFIVVGLVIIMFLLGVFYMSCSSKNTELRLSLEKFEERIRSLTIKNSDAEKKYENLNFRKRELDEEKLTIQRQMEKKDSEINDLNTKLNEKLAELQSLSSDKKVLDEQLKDYKSLSDTLASKNSLIEKLQQHLNDQKQSNADELTRLKQEYETYKNNRSLQNTQLPSNNEQQSNPIIPPQRFRPLVSDNSTTKSLGSLFKEPINKLNNLTNEIKAEFIPAALDLKEKVLNAFGINTNSSTTTISNQQQDINNGNNPQQVGQNVPPPPLANHAQRQQQQDHVESAQAAPQHIDDPQAGEDNPRYRNNLQRSANNPPSDNKDDKLADLNEHDDEEEEEMNADNAPQNANPIKQNNLENNREPAYAPPLGRSNKKNQRINNRKRNRGSRNRLRQEQRLDNGAEIDANDNNEEYRSMRKRSVA